MRLLLRHLRPSPFMQLVPDEEELRVLLHRITTLFSRHKLRLFIHLIVNSMNETVSSCKQHEHSWLYYNTIQDKLMVLIDAVMSDPTE